MKKLHKLIVLVLIVSPYSIVYNYNLHKCEPSCGQIDFETRDTLLYNIGAESSFHQLKPYRERNFLRDFYKKIIRYLINNVKTEHGSLLFVGEKGSLFLTIKAEQTDCDPSALQGLLSFVTQETYPPLNDDFFSHCPSNFFSKSYQIITDHKHTEKPMRQTGKDINAYFEKEKYITSSNSPLQTIANLVLWIMTHNCTDPFLLNACERIKKNTRTTLPDIGDIIGVIAFAENKHAVCIEPKKKIKAAHILLYTLANKEKTKISDLGKKIRTQPHKNRTRLDIAKSAW